MIFIQYIEIRYDIDAHEENIERMKVRRKYLRRPQCMPVTDGRLDFVYFF